MAYAFASGSQQHVVANTAAVSGVPLTMACWTRLASASSALAAISINASGAGSHRYQIVFANATNRYRANAVSTVTTGFAEATAGPTVGVWGHVAAVFPSANSRTMFFNGGNSGTSSVTSSPTESMGRTVIGAVYASGAAANTYDGDIAEVGVWSAALTAAEIAALARGVQPDQVRPQSLVFYAPMIRDLIDVRAGLPLTNTNSATVADHPRVYA